MTRRAQNPPRGVRVQRVVPELKKSGPTPRDRRIDGPEDVIIAVRDYIGNRAAEMFVVLFMDVRNRLVGFTEMTDGSPTGVGVSPQGLFREGLLVNAAGFVTIHNHPSGDPSPSVEDRRLWERLRESGKLIGIICMDNFVLGETHWFSEAMERTSAYPTAAFRPEEP